LSTDRAKTFFHSSSFTANPVACAAAAANIAMWQDEPVRERIAALAARQAAMIGRLAQLPGAANPRTCGTIAAIDVSVPDSGYLSTLGPRLLALFREADVLLRPLGNTIYVMPPYCLDEADHVRIDAAIATALNLVGAPVRAARLAL
jgi:adenosylmethionine-8-amino-7-oxononanoate aminotransferase